MSTLRKMHMGLGLALVTALALSTGAATANDADVEIDEASPGESADWIQPGTTFFCSMSGPTAFTRSSAQLTILADGWHCARERTGGGAPLWVDSCHKVAQQVGCQLIN